MLDYSKERRKFEMRTKVKKQKMKTSLGDKIFVVINSAILICLCFVTLYPIWYVLCASLTSNTYLVSHPGIMLLIRFFYLDTRIRCLFWQFLCQSTF